MKTMKRFLSCLLVVMMMAAMLVMPASAADYSITIETSTSGHTYEVYQIFVGDLNSTGVLTHIQWGNGITEAGKTALGNAETLAGNLKSPTDADSFGILIDEYLTNPVSTAGNPTDIGSGKTGYKIDVTTPGYYLIKDKDASLGTDANDAYTKYMIQVVGNVTVAPKSGVCTLAKRVSRSPLTGYANGASASLGTPLYFELRASLHNQMGAYSQYTLEFTDTLPAGLTYDSIYGVYVSNENTPTSYEPIDSSNYTVDESLVASNNIVKVTIPNTKAVIEATTNAPVVPEDQIVVIVQTSLNTNAVYGKAGNENKATLRFSNNPYDTNSMGQTATATATAYTYKVQIKKVDQVDNSKTLPGAEFVAYHYRNSTDLEYITVDSFGNFTGTVLTESEATKMTSDSNGLLGISGLPFGTFYFKEVTPPSGYNLRTEDVAVTVTQSIDPTTGALTALSADATNDIGAPTVSLDNGTILVTVGNRAGTVLPSTGGIGTTIFYIAGAALMIGAATVLVTKKHTQK